MQQQQNLNTVPVVWERTPLMPTSQSRARRSVAKGKATPFWSLGIYCIRLNEKPVSLVVQEVVAAVDPGSKKEGYTVKSEAHTYINIQCDAVTWVKDAVKTSSEMRRGRRFRKTPCRKNKQNRKRNENMIPPSTKARWQLKLRILRKLAKIYPIGFIGVEDVKAKTLKKRSSKTFKWNGSFSPLEVGKQWFYRESAHIAPVTLFQGYETFELRKLLGLKKSSKKMADIFEAHCIDSWVMTNAIIGGHIEPDNKNMLCVAPLQFHRRQLHALQPTKGGIRRPYGGTMSEGFKRGQSGATSKVRLGNSWWYHERQN